MHAGTVSLCLCTISKLIPSLLYQPDRVGPAGAARSEAVKRMMLGDLQLREGVGLFVA